MMPLALATPGEENLIRKVGGSPEVKKHLEDQIGQLYPQVPSLLVHGACRELF